MTSYAPGNLNDCEVVATEAAGTATGDLAASRDLAWKSALATGCSIVGLPAALVSSRFQTTLSLPSAVLVAVTPVSLRSQSWCS